MTDTLSPAERSERMSRVRSKDTGAEITVRKLVHAMGFRYRLHRRELPGVPDLVFSGRKKVVFVHGCFWHRHPSARCHLARLPKSNLEFWNRKLTANRDRDVVNEKRLQEAGWQVLVVWECELGDKAGLELKLRQFLGGK